MTIGDVSKCTGYGLSSVAMWCNENRLRFFDMGSRYMIPKPYLLDFIMGPYFKGMKVKRAERKGSDDCAADAASMLSMED